MRQRLNVVVMVVVILAASLAPTGPASASMRAAASGVFTKSDFVFRRVEAFRKGFFSDFATCTQTYGNSSTTPSS